MREGRGYEGSFPTFEQILAGDPTATFPREIWLQQVQPGEFAVRHKDFKTGLAGIPRGSTLSPQRFAAYSVKQALISKYGPPTFEKDGGRTYFSWHFDPAGNRVPPASQLSSSSSINTPTPDVAVN